MIKSDKSVVQKIDRKWVRESKRTFSEYPGMPRNGVLGEEETWLELTQFYRDDLKWLLSLDHHKFWSHMIYSEKAHEFLVSFLKRSPPNCVKKNFLVREDMRSVFKEIEHMVFLAFLRLSTEKESDSCYVRNFRDVIYNYYLFTVPVILDICLIYGTSNHELVRNMIHNVITSAPDFLDDFQEIMPHFIHALKTVKEKFSHISSPDWEGKMNSKSSEVLDLVLYICDTVATIQIFLEMYPNVCQLFSRGDVITEIVNFYSNVLPGMAEYLSEKQLSLGDGSPVSNLIEDVRIDMLKIVKSILDFILNESKVFPEKRDETVNEYLTLVMKFLAEPVFLSDYNLMYTVEFEVECAIRDCKNVDFTQVNQILEGVTSTESDVASNLKENFIGEDLDVNGAKLNSLITEVKDIFPHLGDDFIRKCLSYYDNNTESVIAAVLENQIPPHLNKNEEENLELTQVLEFKGKHKSRHRNLNEMLNDREEMSAMKERYAQLSFVIDETYDDEYDDTYDENMDVSLREGDEMWRRPFVVPRVLRTGEEIMEEGEEGEGEEYDIEEEKKIEDNFKRDCFVENPAVLRERIEQTKLERSRRDVAGRGRGQGQSKQVLKNREFKESHKSHIANHNRKKQAGRKMARGMIPS